MNENEESNKTINELGRHIANEMAKYENSLNEFFSNLPFSRREKKRMAKVERKNALKERKRK